MSYRGKLLVRDKRFELLTTVESGRDSTTELITQNVLHATFPIVLRMQGRILVPQRRLELLKFGF